MSSTSTFEELAAAAASSKSLGEAVLKLGRQPTRNRNRYVTDLMRAPGIDCAHFRNASELYTQEMLREAAAASKTVSEVVRRLGAKEMGGTVAYIGRRLRHYGVDTSHFESVPQRRRPRDVPQAEFVDAIACARTATPPRRPSAGKSNLHPTSWTAEPTTG